MTALPNPFVGPRSFETGEALYGRDRELRTLSALLIAERIVMLHSPSGAGKTSLVKAGLLPRLIEENFNVLPVVRVNIEPPAGIDSTNRYLTSTLISLEECFPADQRIPIAELVSLGLNDYLNQRVPQKDSVIIIDQFEEILTISPEDRDGKLNFFNELGLALRNKHRWALFSIREDYMGALTPYLRPIPNRLATRFRLDLLSNEAALQAMQQPAQKAGVTFSTSAAQKLVDDLRRIQVQMPDGTIEKQLGQYVEPVQLQVVCYRLWENKSADDNEINEKNLDRVGNVNDSLADYFAASIAKVAQSSNTPERSIREWFDRKLISPDGIRGQVRLGSESSDGLPNIDVSKLVDAHIIRAEQRAGQTWIELSHDRMIEPVLENNHKWFEANLRLFQRRATLWVEQNRSEGLLLRGAELDKAELDSRGIDLTPDESAYLAACRVLKLRVLRDINQRRWIVIGLAGSILLFFVALYYSITATNANQGYIDQKQTAQAASTQAIDEKIKAYAASTEAVNQKIIAQQARNDALTQQSLAVAAENTAVVSANQAATAEAVANQQRDKANQQEQLALEQKKSAEANALVAQSILAQNQGNIALTNLLAVAAFNLDDDSATRTRLLYSVTNSGRLFLTENSTQGVFRKIAFSAGNSKMASEYYSGCKDDNYFLCTTSGIIKLWGISNGANSSISLNQDPNPIGLNGQMLDAIAVSPDGSTIAAASCNPVNNDITKCEKEDITIWDFNSRKQSDKSFSLSDITISNEKSVDLAYSPDGKMLAISINTSNIFNASSSTRPLIILWDVLTNHKIGLFEVKDGIQQMAFSPDSKTLAIASSSLILVDVASVNAVTPPHLEKVGSAPIWSLAYTPNGKMLAVGNNDKTISLLDTTKFAKIGQPLILPSSVDQDPNSIPVSMAFSPDGKILASGHKFGLVVLWDVASQTKLAGPLYNHVDPLQKKNYPVFSLSFTPDGKFLATASTQIILWDMDKTSWIAKACKLAGRDFTQAEWQITFGDQPYKPVCGG